MNTRHRNIKYQVKVLSCLVILLCISCIKPVYPSEMYLQHSVTAVMIIVMVFIIKKQALSDMSFTLVAAFLLLHVIGARWIYSYVPYEKWIESLSGVSLSGIASSGRNHYDRFVHLMFGLMIFRPLKEVCEDWLKMPARLAGVMAFLIILGLSLVYEVFEWGLTLILSPQDAEDYNGQQGDMWDAQKDMALAMTGALIPLLAGLLRRHLVTKNKSAD